ncbi:MAG: hypothetical protein P4L99_21370 [Chthoniobacter sp.]|nr:hypothetical protein [Chthoniobacter sp.]
MLAKVFSGAVYGVEAFEVEIEVDAGKFPVSHGGNLDLNVDPVEERLLKI